TQFQSARDAVQRPTMQDRDKIAVFGAHISTDNQQIAAYVRANCTAG
ncbi:MAG: hypothetical protein QOG80_1356, partial [Pseudonocardiales bacterium]|nr:hypothetical protein [Pseudonocardiales bacterium]